MNAAPAFPGKKTVTQPDGTTIEVRMVGDERFHTLVTDTDALPIARDADGEYRYRMAEARSRPLPPTIRASAPPPKLISSAPT